MKFRSFFKKGDRQRCPPSEDNVSGAVQEGQTPQRSRFSFLGRETTKAATHNRSESNETSITQLSINESYSAEGHAFVEEANGAYEVLSSNHMVKYGKSLLELDAAGGGREASLREANRSASEKSSVEGLSCIMEEASREGRSLDCSAGTSSREASPNSSQHAASLLNNRDEIDEIGRSQRDDDRGAMPLKAEQSLSQQLIAPRMIRMDGSILQRVGDSWIDCIDLCNTNPTQIIQDRYDLSSFEEESRSSRGHDEFSGRTRRLNSKKKTHRRSSRNHFNFLGFFSRNVEPRLNFARNGSSLDSTVEIAPSSMTQAANDGNNTDLEQRTANERWTASDGTPRFLA